MPCFTVYFKLDYFNIIELLIKIFFLCYNKKISKEVHDVISELVDKGKLNKEDS